MNTTRDRLERDVSRLATDVREKIAESATKTAQRAAQLLRENFDEADDAARRAAQRHERAAGNLVWRIVLIALIVQAVVLIGVWLLVRTTIPSREEIEARRAEVAQLRTQLEYLERKGARLELIDCIDERKRLHLCFRTDERNHQGAFRPEGVGKEKTYRIPWGN